MFSIYWQANWQPAQSTTIIGKKSKAKTINNLQLTLQLLKNSNENITVTPQWSKLSLLSILEQLVAIFLGKIHWQAHPWDYVCPLSIYKFKKTTTETLQLQNSMFNQISTWSDPNEINTGARGIQETVLHRESKKQDTKHLPITSPNVNRFSKFFQWQTYW